MKKIIFIRHCKAEMGGVDKERKLDEDGISQSKSLGIKLNHLLSNNVKVYSSPFTRAIQSILTLKELNNKIDIETKAFLEEIDHGKSKELSKHEIIKKMWEDENFFIEGHDSQKKHFEGIKKDLDKIIHEFTAGSHDLVLVTHGNLLGMILKFYFNKNFGFDEWKRMSMPDLYILPFDENSKPKDFIRNVENIDKIYYI
tara:strand:- start:544 stop:1140 length:597 start_codon:yes stop_codon:yes gene_type:complete